MAQPHAVHDTLLLDSHRLSSSPFIAPPIDINGPDCDRSDIVHFDIVMRRGFARYQTREKKQIKQAEATPIKIRINRKTFQKANMTNNNARGK